MNEPVGVALAVAGVVNRKTPLHAGDVGGLQGADELRVSRFSRFGPVFDDPAKGDTQLPLCYGDTMRIHHDRSLAGASAAASAAAQSIAASFASTMFASGFLSDALLGTAGALPGSFCSLREPKVSA